jgi:hypothetical protein
LEIVMLRLPYPALVVAFAMGLPPPASCSEPALPRIEQLRIESAALGEVLSAEVYVPHGYDPKSRHATIYTYSGDIYLKMDSGFRPRLEGTTGIAAGNELIVSIPFPSNTALAAALSRLDGNAPTAFADFVADELVPAVEARYSAEPDRKRRWLLAFSSGAVQALDLAITKPEVFSRVAAQSPGWMIWDGEKGVIGADFTDNALARIFAHCGRLNLLSTWFVWGDSDTDDWERRSRTENGPRVLKALSGCGARVETSPAVPGEHDLSLVGASAGAALEFLRRAEPSLAPSITDDHPETDAPTH